MAAKFICPNCGYSYRVRSQRSCCPRCKTRLSTDEMQSQALWYLIGGVIVFVIAAAMGGFKR